MWHVTPDTWHLTHDTWRMVNILSKLHVPSSNALGFILVWRITHLINQWINDGGVCRTTGLIIISKRTCNMTSKSHIQEAMNLSACTNNSTATKCLFYCLVILDRLEYWQWKGTDRHFRHIQTSSGHPVLAVLTERTVCGMTDIATESD